jgi:hypothetical protein
MIQQNMARHIDYWSTSHSKDTVIWMIKMKTKTTTAMIVTVWGAPLDPVDLVRINFLFLLCFVESYRLYSFRGRLYFLHLSSNDRTPLANQ